MYDSYQECMNFTISEAAAEIFWLKLNLHTYQVYTLVTNFVKVNITVRAEIIERSPSHQAKVSVILDIFWLPMYKCTLYDDTGSLQFVERSLVPKAKISTTKHVQLLQWLHSKQQQ